VECKTRWVTADDVLRNLRYSAREERRRDLSNTASMAGRQAGEDGRHNMYAWSTAAGLGCAGGSNRLVSAGHGCGAEGVR
jgi:hypothetical protein